MLGNAHKLNVCISHVFDIGCKSLCKFFIRIEAFRIVVRVRMLHPGARMHLIDRERLLLRRILETFLHPCRIRPFKAVDIRYSGGCSRTFLHPVAVRVCFVKLSAVSGVDQVFVKVSFFDFRNKYLPYAHIGYLFHRIGSAVPSVEITDNGYASCVRCPYREPYSVPAVLIRQMGTHFFEYLVVCRLSEQVLVQLSKMTVFFYVCCPPCDLSRFRIFFRSIFSGTSSAGRGFFRSSFLHCCLCGSFLFL